MNFSGFDGIPPTRQSDNPSKLFDEAPKPAGINDLYKSQAQALDSWYENNKRDTVVKLHTGGGKTLVGLLIAKSLLISTRKPVLYLVQINNL
jgi:replicative superfamily II helicase